MRPRGARRRPAEDARSTPPLGARARALVAALIISFGALVLGLGAAGGTYALLSASAETPEATLTAGSFDLRIGGESPSATVTPASPVLRTFTVTSVGDVPSALSVRIAATSTQAITANTQVRISPLATGATCTVGLSGQIADLDGYTNPSLGRLEAGGTRSFCLELRLKPGTPATQSGQGVAFSIRVDGSQEDD